MTIPFLLNFTPYNLNGIAASSINDMVSIDTEQLVEQSEILYELGTNKNINLPISIKNLTNNAQLQVTLQFDKTVLSASLPDVFLLSPEETKTFNIRLNVDGLNNMSRNTDTEFDIVVENLSTGAVVTKSPNVTSLNKKLLTQTIPTVM